MLPPLPQALESITTKKPGPSDAQQHHSWGFGLGGIIDVRAGGWRREGEGWGVLVAGM